MRREPGLEPGPDGVDRCWWCVGDDLYVAYHDTEWGRPVTDDVRLFEKICLEGFQAGLSWLTILKKRENFRTAFSGFNFDRVALFGEKDIQRLLGDAGIVRHRGKIEATINNAQRCIEIFSEFGSFSSYVWGFEPKPSERPKTISKRALMEMATTPASTAMSKDLRKRGWKFVGPTTIYAFMQAMGLVNDHIEGCEGRNRAESERAQITSWSQ